MHPNSYEKSARNNRSHYKDCWNSCLHSNDGPITNKSRQPPLKLRMLIIHHPVAVAARSKAQVCERSPADMWVRIPRGARMSVCCECFVLWGRGLCVGLITRPEESYRVWCIIVCDLGSSWMRKSWPTGGCCAKKRKNNALDTIPPLLWYCSFKELVYLLMSAHTELRIISSKVTSSDVNVGYSGKGMPYRFWETCSFYNFTIRIEAAGYSETFFYHGATAPSGPRPPHCRGFMITLRHTTVDRTPLDERSARRRDLNLTKHITHNRKTCMRTAGFEPTIPGSERPPGSAWNFFTLLKIYKDTS